MLGIACQKGVVDRLVDKAGVAATIRNREALHDLPGGKVGAADITHFALTDQVIECPKSFLKRHEAIGIVRHVQVDVVGLQAVQTVFTRLQKMFP